MKEMKKGFRCAERSEMLELFTGGHVPHSHISSTSGPIANDDGWLSSTRKANSQHTASRLGKGTPPPKFPGTLSLLPRAPAMQGFRYRTAYYCLFCTPLGKFLYHRPRIRASIVVVERLLGRFSKPLICLPQPETKGRPTWSQVPAPCPAL